MSQGSLNPKIRFPGQKLCSDSEYRGHPFRFSGIFPSTYHQGSVQQFYSKFIGVESSVYVPFCSTLDCLFPWVVQDNRVTAEARCGYFSCVIDRWLIFVGI